MKKVVFIVEGKTLLAQTQTKVNHQVELSAAWAQRHLLVACASAWTRRNYQVASTCLRHLVLKHYWEEGRTAARVLEDWLVVELRWQLVVRLGPIGLHWLVNEVRRQN